MKFDFSIVDKKTFIHPRSQNSFGTIRVSEDPKTILKKRFKTFHSFALDDCGNTFFISQKGIVLFFDHETESTINLSFSFDDFVRNCTSNFEIEYKDENVISAWIDPEFARKQGINVPDDGKIK